MLNLSHVSKTYRPKKGVEVRALKDISLSIKEKGLIFLLGKSGSGKSTLMNLIGGLDSPDQGEIIVYDKNIVSLSIKDYDAYRNTTVGFIFQEFNLIDSFSIYKNISLSLELQGRLVQREEIENLLERLDLSSEIDRMPQELSGGQKQRVSIARALIKKPKIILADEPTGSLDSETGKQIFEVLKELSKQQLVIVVSHDRDYAETYADRIIELSDGEIIKDTNTIHLEKNTETLSLVKSRMPFKDAFLLGFSAFKRKPVRMVFTLLLLIFAFTLFGVVDTTSNYNINDVIIHNLYHRDESTLVISRTTYSEINEYEINVPFSLAYFEDLKREYPDYYFKEVFIAEEDFNTVYNPQYAYDYYPRYFSGVIEIDQKFLDSTGFLLVGRLPENENEVVIPMHFYENYEAFGYQDNGKILINNPQDLLNKFLDTEKTRKIVGILDTKFNKERYQRVLDNNIEYEIAKTLSSELRKINDGSLHTYYYTYPGYINQKVLVDNPNQLRYDYVNVDTYSGEKGNIFDMNDSDWEIFEARTIEKITSFPEETVFKEGFNSSRLKDNQIILSMHYIKSYAAQDVQNDFEDQAIIRQNTLIDDFSKAHFDEISAEFEIHTGGTTWQEYANYIKEHENVPYFDIEYREFLIEAQAKLALEIYWNLDSYFKLNLQKNFSNLSWITADIDIEIVGYYKGENVLVSSDLYEEIIEMTSPYPYKQVVVSLSGDKKDDLNLINELNNREQRFEADNETAFMMGYVNDPIVFFAGILVWVALGLAGFSGLLFYNFMSVSIHHKKKDIGILRALGARRSDVFMIFFSEAFIIAMIVFTISFGTTHALVLFGDGYIVNHFGLEVSIIWVKFRQFITLLSMIFLVAFLSSWIPIYRFARQKPIDIIKLI